ncbi:MAG TPA: 3-hydroxyacyl-ACP dehydratase FabZ [Chlamydiales bacterium]|nr:3-hydroxyacyl-ACP dehydratase FabZ [Chlamydiales bacterium]
MAESKEPVLGPKKIAEILPHRYPFLLVDKVNHLDLENDEIIAQKNVTINEEFFLGHFPCIPVMPGVLILEALAQTGGILVHQKGFVSKIAVLLNVAKAKFRAPVVPGSVLQLHVKGLHISSKGGKVQGKAMIDDKVVAEAEICFALVDKGQLLERL